MPSIQNRKNRRIKDALCKKDILRYFQKGEVEKTKRIGIEAEKFGIVVKTRKNAIYSGKNGYLAILKKLCEELGWKIVKQNGKFILKLQRGNTILNLESDGRIELAGSPRQSIHDIAREFRIHQNEITEISNVYGIGWLGTGYNPIGSKKELEDIPGDRKNEMITFFESIARQTGNDFGLTWHKKTSGIHCTIDYFSEKDFSKKAKILFRITPLLKAMFANSPFSKEKFTGYMSYRSHMQLSTGIPRFHMTKKLYKSEFSYQDWIQHVCAQDIIFLQKQDKWIYPSMTFEKYLQNGYEGFTANMDDFHMHMRSIWMDVRLRNTIELRCIDSVPPSLVPSVAALLKGLMYNQSALKELEKMTSSWTFHEFEELQRNVAKDALKTKIRGEPLLEICKSLLNMAEYSLQKDQIVDAKGKDESQFLEPLKEFVFLKGQSPAEWIVEMWQGDWNKSLFPVLEWYQY